jgi:Glycosyltransferase
MENIINKFICNKVLMVGLSYKVLPGGMSSVIQYYDPHFEKLRYVSTYRYYGKISRIIYFSIATIKIFLLLLLDRRLQIVHIHSAADGSFVRASIVMKICKLFGKKILLHSHASRFKDYYNESSNKTKILKNLNMADVLIVLSKSWKIWFQTIGVDDRHIMVLNNITALPQIKVTTRTDDKLHLLFLGLLGERKGIFDIIKSMSEHKKDFQNKLIFRIGGNTHEDELISAIKHYGLEEFVTFEGWVSGDKKTDLLNWADAYILPSYNEGLPIGILEAMSYGCAIIASPVGGIPEVVKNKHNGIIVQPGNTDDIANAIRDLFDKETLMTMSDTSKEIVKDYLPDEVIRNLSNIYRSVLENN